MSKTIKLNEAQLGLVKEGVDYVVSGVESANFTIAAGTQVLSIEGNLTGAKIGTLVQVKDGVLGVAGKQAAPAAGERKRNPSAEVLKEFGLQ